MKDLAVLQLLVVASTFILTYGLHGALAQGVALLAGRAIASPRQRSLLWKVALFLPFATAIVAVAGVRPAGVASEIHLPDLWHPPGVRVPRKYLLTAQVLRSNTAPFTSTSFSIDSVATRTAAIAAALAVLAAIGGMAGLIGRRVAFRRRLGERRELPRRQGTAAIPGIRVTTSATLSAPVALRRSEICVPGHTFALLTARQQQSVLAHEAAHLRHRDPFWFSLADLALALAPWQLFGRQVMRQLRRDAEFACDDTVRHAMGDGRALVESLAVLARAFDPQETEFAASCGGSPLEERARRLLTPSTPTGRWRGRVLALVLTAMVGGLYFGAPILSPPAVHVPAAGAISGRVTQLMLLDSTARSIGLP